MAMSYLPPSLNPTQKFCINEWKFIYSKMLVGQFFYHQVYRFNRSKDQQFLFYKRILLVKMRSGSTADPVSWCHDEEQSRLFHWFFFFFHRSSHPEHSKLIKPWLKTEFSTFNLLNPLISYWRNLPGALPYWLLCSYHVTPWNGRLQTKLWNTLE